MLIQEMEEVSDDPFRYARLDRRRPDGSGRPGSGPIRRARCRAKPCAPRRFQTVMVCAGDTQARRAYRQTYGSTPSFVTAQEALAARQTGQRWATPRCMTAHQYNRLAGPPVQRAAL